MENALIEQEKLVVNSLDTSKSLLDSIKESKKP